MKTSNERVTAYRKKAQADGKVRREYYATEEEHLRIKKFLKRIRHKA